MTTTTPTPSMSAQPTTPAVQPYVLAAIRRVRSTKQLRAQRRDQFALKKVPACAASK